MLDQLAVSVPHTPTSADNLRGIVALLVSQALFVTSDSVVKLAGAMMPVTQIMAIRGTMAVLIAGTVLALTVDAAKWRLAFQPLVAGRAALEALLAALFLFSLPHLALGDITVIMQITPLVITMLSALVLREFVGWRRWLAIVLGFVGVVLVAQPGAQAFNFYVITAVIVAILVAVRDLMTRRLDRSTPTTAVTFTTTLSVCVLGFAGAPLEVWQPLTVFGMLLLAASAVLVTMANVFIIRAFRGVDVSAVSPFRYFGVVWAIILGYAIWSDLPNSVAIAGTLLIVGSGLYTMHRETVRLRQHQ